MPPALMLPSALGTWSMFLGPVCAPVTVLSPMERARGSLMAVSAPQALYSWWVPPALLLHPCLGTRWEEGLGEPGCWGAGSGGSSLKEEAGGGLEYWGAGCRGLKELEHWARGWEALGS